MQWNKRSHDRGGPRTAPMLAQRSSAAREGSSADGYSLVLQQPIPIAQLAKVSRCLAHTYRPPHCMSSGQSIASAEITSSSPCLRVKFAYLCAISSAELSRSVSVPSTWKTRDAVDRGITPCSSQLSRSPMAQALRGPVAPMPPSWSSAPIVYGTPRLSAERKSTCFGPHVPLELKLTLSLLSYTASSTFGRCVDETTSARAAFARKPFFSRAVFTVLARVTLR
mmetsp:Transcript_3739/g.7799  ORF Transcript_3739/g.7799 Transcript_3739/m.7799 type:complete len:224 (+) Transcript_3739:866-1537(+)